MKIRQLSCIEHTNNDDLGNKTSLEIYNEKYIFRFRWSVIPKRNKFNVDVLLLDGDWRNLIVVHEENDLKSGFQFFDEYDTTLIKWSDKMKILSQRINEEIEELKSKKWL